MTLRMRDIVHAAFALPILLWGTLLHSSTALASSPPAWMQAQVGIPTPEHEADANAVLLYSEAILTVQPNGKLKHLDRKVYRILRPDGRGLGVVRVDVDSQMRLDTLRAWSIPATGKSYEVGERDAIESSLSGVANGELVTDVRTKLLRIPAAVPNSLIGYEIEVEERPYLMTDEWVFEDTVPVREAHYTLQLPPGWSFKSQWLNHEQQAPVSSSPGQTHWVVRDLKAIDVEEQMPPWQGIAARLVIALIPPAGQVQGFQNWSEMGAWYQGVVRGRTDPSPEIKQKTAELTAGVASQLGKMKALASFVQNDVRYVAIELGIGGLQPHPAAEVFAHRFGDCKDKATLLASMFREIGIESYYLIVNTTRGSITATTPPTLGFNHAILAVRLPAGLEDPSLVAVASHDKVGRILFFDPTDPLTPLGRLRGGLQSNYGLLVLPDGGELLRTPQLPAELNAISRTAKLSLDEAGLLRGDVRETWSGDMAALQRATENASTQDTDRIRPVESVAASSFSTFQILKASVGNARLRDQPYEWIYSVEASGYAKSAGNLLLVRPRVLGSKTSGLLETRKPRRYPIEFDGPRRDTDTFEIALPAGYVVDELPRPVDADYGFAAYHSKTESLGHALRYTRTFEIREVSVAVSKAEQLRQFYRIIEDDERNSAVLRPADTH
jgi:transglutaminase-like putative cysteine protease